MDYLTEFQRSFQLKAPPSEIFVVVDEGEIGAEQFKIIKERELNSTKHLLYIPALPAASKTIDVTYKLDSDLDTRFYFPEYNGGELECELDGVHIKSKYFPSSKTIEFSPTPLDGQIVNCKFPAGKI